MELKLILNSQLKLTLVLFFSLLASACAYKPGTPLEILDGSRSGVIHFMSTDDYDIHHDGPTTPLIIDGTLTFPQDHRGGVMILSHGSGGWSNLHEFWAGFFRDHGFATFSLNHFGPRDVISTIHSQVRVTEQQMASDIIHAAKLLVTDSRIKPTEIFHIGWSKGATAGLLAAVESNGGGLNQGPGQISGYIEFYPYCGFSGDIVSASKILVLHGKADDWTPIASCERLVDNMQAAGSNITLKAFKGALHGFDNWAANTYKLPAGLTIRDISEKCTLVYSRDKPLITVDGKHTVGDFQSRKAFLRACAERGVSYGGSPQHRDTVNRLLLEFVGIN